MGKQNLIGKDRSLLNTGSYIHTEVFLSEGCFTVSIFIGLYSFLLAPGVPPGVHIRGTSFSDGDS